MKKHLSTFVAVLCTFVFVFAVYSQDDATVFVTRTGSKYHTAGCSYLRKSAIPMKLSEAIGRYSPCSRCNPPTSLARAEEPAGQSKGIASPSNISTPDSSGLRKHPGDKGVGTTPHGQPLYEGPRGGRYHYSKSGKKIYEKKKH